MITEQLHKIIELLGGTDTSDNMITSKLDAVIALKGGTETADNLITTKLKYIAELLGGSTESYMYTEMIADIIAALGGECDSRLITEQLDAIIGKLSKKTIVSIVDDGGRKTVNSSGFASYFNGLNIPIALGTPTIVDSGTGSTLSKAEMDALVASGNEICVKGTASGQIFSNYTDMDEFESVVKQSYEWSVRRGYQTDVCAYAGGLQPSTNPDLFDSKLDVIKKYFKYGMNVNTTSESTSLTKGVWNEVPLITMYNGYSKGLLLNRLEVTYKNNMSTYTWWKDYLDKAIANKGYLILFTRTYDSSFTTAPSGYEKSGFDAIKEVVQYLKDNDCEFLTPSNALKKIN